MKRFLILLALVLALAVTPAGAWVDSGQMGGGSAGLPKGTKVVGNDITFPDKVTIGAAYSGVARVNGATNATLTAAQVGGTQITNSGQTVASTQTLPACSALVSYSFLALIETKVAQDFKFLRAGADTVCLDGVCSKTYIKANNQEVGSMLQCVSGATAWHCKTVLGTWTTE